VSAQVRIYQQGSADLSLTQFEASRGFGAGSLNPFLVCYVLIFFYYYYFSPSSLLLLFFLHPFSLFWVHECWGPSR